MTYTHGQKLKQIREESGLTPEKLVSLVQDDGAPLTFRTYERMEREGYFPKRDGNLFLELISKHLGCKISDIRVVVGSDKDQAA